MSRLDEDLKMVRDTRERLTAMLGRVKAAPDLLDSDELMHVTSELVKSLEAEIQALEKAIGGAEQPKSRAMIRILTDYLKQRGLLPKE
jgi:hypothetical protein